MQTEIAEMTRDDVMRETVAHVRRVGDLMLDAVEQLQRRAVHHDASKFSPAEFESFAQETPGLRALTYGSPEYKEALARLGPALAHHYRCNRHHPEHFGTTTCDQCGNDESEPCVCGGPRKRRGDIHKMDLLDLIEMLADWKAATERHANGSLPKSIVGNAKRFGYDDAMVRLLAQTARNLEWITEADFRQLNLE